MKRRSVSALLAGATIPLWASGAFAQAAVAPASPTGPDQATRVQDAAGSAGLQEIVVTAQRREERSIRVPISISAFSGLDMKRLSINIVNDLQFSTPGLTFPEDNGVTTPFIRGRGSNFVGPGLEGSIAIYVDDVYQESQFGTSDLVDTSLLQVLKGPQGTLYGRNATGGAILIQTANPTHEFDGHVELGYGNLNAWRGEAVVNVPMSETLALRFAAGALHRDGHLHNLVDGKEQGGTERYQLRAKALWEPTANFSALLKGEYQRRYLQYERQLIYDGAGNPTNLGFYNTIQSPVTPRIFGGENRTRTWSGTLRLNYQAGDWQFTSTTAYKDVEHTTCSDNDFRYAVIQRFCVSVPKGEPRLPQGLHGSYDRTFSDELRVSSSLAGPVNFTVGTAYQHSDASFPGVLRGSAFGIFLPVFDSHTQVRSYSAYGEVYYELLPGLKLTAGGRYNKDQKGLQVTNYPDVAPGFGLPPALVPNFFSQKASFSNFTPRAVVSYGNDDANYYVSYSAGFKSGGFNVPAFLPQSVLKPEKTRGFEAGAKVKLFDNKMRLDVAVFSTKTTELQVASIDRNIVVQQNAAAAKAQGVEGNVQIAPSDHVKFQVGAAYLHSRYTSFPAASVFSLQNGTLSPSSEDLKGFQTTNSPDFTANANATYSIDLPRRWSASFTVAGRYSTAYDFSAGAGGPLRLDRQKAFGLMNVTGTIAPPGDYINISWYVDNVFQTHYYDVIQTNSGGLGVYGAAALPRTYGVELRYSF